VLSDVLSHNLTVLGVGVRENVLDEIVAVLVAGDVDQWDARTIETAFTDSIKIAAEEVNTANLEALLNDLGCKLVHAILRSIADDMVNGSAAVSWGTWIGVSRCAGSCGSMRGQRVLNAQKLARHLKRQGLKGSRVYETSSE
jgi:hypothetical protein